MCQKEIRIMKVNIEYPKIDNTEVMNEFCPEWTMPYDANQEIQILITEQHDPIVFDKFITEIEEDAIEYAIFTLMEKYSDTVEGEITTNDHELLKRTIKHLCAIQNRNSNKEGIQLSVRNKNNEQL